MSSTLLRLGLWTLILVLALYVIVETYGGEQDWVEMIPMRMLQQVMVVSVVVIIAGIVLRIFDKGARVVTKNRCKVCRTTIPAGAMFCREHLRSILSEEDEKTHMTRIRRT